ncbi:hypothetical protein Pmani_020020 [Petrolisthes manimaculis]|uniref:Major facilitator superfamily (MFS) profile domain-containing protein n=1 Tax=Petrolisthes manimaculis TaxID=1843537 RepID=A0AAE1U3G9_9EUCA|nr:hypothetical protein Pmani_020020 [Petrolisthes manimaculis]
MLDSFDDVLTHLGTGKWNIFHFIACAYGNIIIIPHTLGRPFLAPKLDFTCLYDDNDNTTLIPAAASGFWSHNDNATHDFLTNSTNGDECRRLVETDKGMMWQSCSHWHFDNTTYTSTITSEFELVCGREHLRTTYQSLYQLGCLIGSPLSGFLADRYGRRSMIRVSSVLYIIMGLGTAWLNDLNALIAIRFIMGIFHAIILIITYILAVEVAEPRRRAALGLSIYLAWAASLIAWGGLGYLLREWRLLHFVGSLPGLLFLPMLWLLDESPRWLMVTGKHREALVVLRKAAKWNNVHIQLPEEELIELMTKETVSKENQESTSSLKARITSYLNEVLVLIKTPYLRKITICTNINFCMGSMVYFGLSLSGSTLSHNPFVYMALSGLMEVPAYTLSIPVVHRFGRRNTAVGTFLFCGVALVILAFIPEDVDWAVMTLAMLGKMTNTAAFLIAFFYANELFPTEVRSRGIGTCSTSSRIGSIIAPYILDLVGTSYSWAPSMVFGVASVLAAGVTQLLPETSGAALPETVADLD